MEIEISGYPKQMEFVQSEAPEIAFIAGVGAGKTYSGALKALDYCLKHPNAWGIITAPTNRILDEATLVKYNHVFPYELISRQIKRPHTVWTLINGSQLHFWSTDNAETIVGAEYAFCHMDEGSLSNYMAYINIKKRLRQRTAEGESYPYQLWITTTPRQLNWLYKEITKNTNPIAMINASTHENTYMTDEQRRIYIESLGLSGKDYEQEIEGKFVLLSGECLISPNILENRLLDCIEPIETRDNGSILIWREPVVGVKYIAGADCADEGGGGVNDLIIMDAQTGEEMAEINADIPADKFAMMCFPILREYNTALFAPERNGTVGGIVLQKMRDMGYDNIYIDDKGKEGWYTSTTAYPPKISRFQMLKEYEEAVRLRRTIIRSSETIGELSTFIRANNDRYEPREGYRSDRIMARAICWQMRKHVDKFGDREGFACMRRTATSYV